MGRPCRGLLFLGLLVFLDVAVALRKPEAPDAGGRASAKGVEVPRRGRGAAAKPEALGPGAHANAQGGKVPARGRGAAAKPEASDTRARVNAKGGEAPRRGRGPVAKPEPSDTRARRGEAPRRGRGPVAKPVPSDTGARANAQGGEAPRRGRGPAAKPAAFGIAGHASAKGGEAPSRSRESVAKPEAPDAKGGEAPFKGNGSVAIMIIGRIMTLQGVQPVEVSKSGKRTLLDLMAGEEDAVEVSLWEKSPVPPPPDSALDPSWPTPADRRATWPSLKEHVAQPIHASLGVTPDIFVCTDRIVGAVPPEVTQVFTFPAGGQHERAYLCYQRVLELGSYDFYIKTRPDFLFLKDLPDLASMRRDRIHTRFRLAVGIRNLSSSHFSWNHCTKSCNGRPASAVGYLNDDMVWVVPGGLADRVFTSPAKAVSLENNFREPDNWLSAPGFAELKITKRFLAAGVRTEPLAVVGFPVSSVHNHKQSVLPCADEPVEKVFCGDHVTRKDRVAPWSSRGPTKTALAHAGGPQKAVRRVP